MHKATSSKYLSYTENILMNSKKKFQSNRNTTTPSKNNNTPTLPITQYGAN